MFSKKVRNPIYCYNYAVIPLTHPLYIQSYFPIILPKPRLHQEPSGVAAPLKLPSVAMAVTAIKVLSNVTKGVIILAYISFMIILVFLGYFFLVILKTETNYMNKNVQGETNLHQPVSQTTTFYWVSTSQTHHRSFPTLTRQRRSATCTHMWSIRLSRSCQHQVLKLPTPFQGRSMVSPLPSQLPPALVATSHDQAQASALRAGDSPSHSERGQIHNLFREAVEFCLGGCQNWEKIDIICCTATHVNLRARDSSAQEQMGKKPNSKDLQV